MDDTTALDEARSVLPGSRGWGWACKLCSPLRSERTASGLPSEESARRKWRMHAAIHHPRYLERALAREHVLTLAREGSAALGIPLTAYLEAASAGYLSRRADTPADVGNPFRDVLDNVYRQEGRSCS